MKLVTPGGYILIIGLFFFSFCEFSCSVVKLASVQGIEMVTGKKIVSENSKLDEVNVKESINIDPVIWADLSFGSAIIGLSGFLIFAAVGRNRGEKIFYAITAGVGAVSQFIIRLHMENELDRQEDFRLINVEYTPAYWLVLVTFVVILLVNCLPNIRFVKKG